MQEEDQADSTENLPLVRGRIRALALPGKDSN